MGWPGLSPCVLGELPQALEGGMKCVWEGRRRSPDQQQHHPPMAPGQSASSEALRAGAWALSTGPRGQTGGRQQEGLVWKG